MRSWFPRLAAPLAIVVSVAATRAPSPIAESGPLTLEKLAEGVFAISPTAAAFDSWQSISNSGAVVLEDCVLVYDSHWTPELAEEAMKLLREHTDLPVRYVVSSHFHGDHTGGYWAYGKEVEILSHQATRDRLVAGFPGLADKLRGEIAQQDSQIAAIPDPTQRARMENFRNTNQQLLERVEEAGSSPFPSLTFQESLALHRGTPTEIHFLGRGHTDGDAVLFLPEHGIAFLGDLLFTRTLPNVADGHTREWIETLERVLELGATRFVPGHGALSGEQEVRELIEYLKWLRGAVKPFVRDGKSVEEAQAGIALPEKYADYEFPMMFPFGIAKVYSELAEGR